MARPQASPTAARSPAKSCHRSDLSDRLSQALKPGLGSMMAVASAGLGSASLGEGTAAASPGPGPWSSGPEDAASFVEVTRGLPLYGPPSAGPRGSDH